MGFLIIILSDDNWVGKFLQLKILKGKTNDWHKSQCRRISEPRQSLEVSTQTAL